MQTFKGLVGSIAAALVVWPCAGQNFRNISDVLDATGGAAMEEVDVNGVSFHHIGVVGQPGGIGTATQGAIVHYGGFLQAVDLKQPHLDTDGDGVPNEISLDNDGDSLSDLDEITGAHFDPETPTQVNLADTDGDGIDDGHESVAGTNPTDTTAYLQIVSVVDLSGGKEITWTARGDGSRSYAILSHDDASFEAPTNVLATETVSGGLAPWYETTATYTNVAPSESGFYAVKALVP